MQANARRLRCEAPLNERQMVVATYTAAMYRGPLQGLLEIKDANRHRTLP